MKSSSSRFTRNLHHFWTCALVAIAASACKSPEPKPDPTPQTIASEDLPPLPQREFRGAWVATVSNIDWPSKRDLSVDEQQAELIKILDRAAALKLNAIVFQVRPACDALYASTLEPWSEYLTGKMGQAPAPFYDPLEFAIAEAHKRGLELHAWFNPYRARHPSARSEISSDHISKTRPELVRQYGKYLWLDPGEEAVQEYSRNVILDVVRRYNVDGVHMDDYFYPYQEKDAAGKIVDFPDEASWKRYVFSGGKLSRADWRRQNVDRFIESTYHAVKAEKPWVKFGISPFGIWRPGFPPEVTGLDAYATLYADARKWFMNGWLDYLAPQLYWPIEPPKQSYRLLLGWWAEQNVSSRHLWPGVNTTAAGKWGAQEIENQIRLTRDRGVSGNIHWNMSSLMRNNGGIADALPKDLYAQPALVPALSWLSDTKPARPAITAAMFKGGLAVAWRAQSPEPVAWWLVQRRINGEWHNEVLPGHTFSTVFGGSPALPDAVAVTGITRFGVTGDPNVVKTGNGD